MAQEPDVTFTAAEWAAKVDQAARLAIQAGRYRTQIDRVRQVLPLLSADAQETVKEALELPVPVGE